MAEESCRDALGRRQQEIENTPIDAYLPSSEVQGEGSGSVSRMDSTGLDENGSSAENVQQGVDPTRASEGWVGEIPSGENENHGVILYRGGAAGSQAFCRVAGGSSSSTMSAVARESGHPELFVELIRKPRQGKMPDS